MNSATPYLLALAEPGGKAGEVITASFSGKQLIINLAQGLTALVTELLEKVFGAKPENVQQILFARITWADLCATGVIVLLVLAVHGLINWFLRRKRRPTDGEAQPTDWRPLIIHAVRKPLHLLLWIYGVYFAATPLLQHLGAPGEPHVLQFLFDTGFDVGFFAVLIWLFVRFTRVAEVRMKRWTAKTSGTLDDVLAPLLVKSLRVVVPIVAVILALPVLGLPQSYASLIGRLTSLLIIGTVAWVLSQAVLLMEKAVMARYDVTDKDNLRARQVLTQVTVLKKTLLFVIAVFTLASVLMTFEEVRRLGTSLLASAGVAGIVIGVAAQRTIANLFAGFQLAMTQPIRIDDVVIVENEWGRIEEFTLTYVVVHIWDDRRLIVPLSYFIEKPFQNWTRVSAELLGSVFVYADYTVPVDEIRQGVKRIVESCADWDRRFWNVQVTDTTERTMQIRVLATSADSSKGWDLRCEIREKLIAFLQQNHRDSLPKVRAAIGGVPTASPGRES